MRRRIANIFAVALGVLSVAMVILGVRSFFVEETIMELGFDPAANVVQSRSVKSASGCLSFGSISFKPTQPFDPSPQASLFPFPADGRWHFRRYSNLDLSYAMSWRLIRPYWSHRHVAWAASTRELRDASIPYWLAIVATGAWPVIRFTRPILRRRREARRRVRKQCVNCGYDLRAHKPGGKCPECGREIAAGTEATTRNAELGKERRETADGSDAADR